MKSMHNTCEFHGENSLEVSAYNIFFECSKYQFFREYSHTGAVNAVTHALLMWRILFCESMGFKFCRTGGRFKNQKNNYWNSLEKTCITIYQKYLSYSRFELRKLFRRNNFFFIHGTFSRL